MLIIRKNKEREREPTTGSVPTLTMHTAAAQLSYLSPLSSARVETRNAESPSTNTKHAYTGNQLQFQLHLQMAG